MPALLLHRQMVCAPSFKTEDDWHTSFAKMHATIHHHHHHHHHTHLLRRLIGLFIASSILSLYLLKRIIHQGLLAGNLASTVNVGAVDTQGRFGRIKLILAAQRTRDAFCATNLDFSGAIVPGHTDRVGQQVLGLLCLGQQARVRVSRQKVVTRRPQVDDRAIDHCR